MNRRPQTATATLELSIGPTAPVGVLTDRHARVRRFSGWIELAAAIEDWRRSTSPAGSRPAPEPDNSQTAK